MLFYFKRIGDKILYRAFICPYNGNLFQTKEIVKAAEVSAAF